MVSKSSKPASTMSDATSKSRSKPTPTSSKTASTSKASASRLTLSAQEQKQYFKLLAKVNKGKKAIEAQRVQGELYTVLETVC